MNVKQLGTGTIHLGYFFLFTAFGGFLVYILSTAVKPIEAAWLEARRRYAIRKCEDDSGIAHVTKLTSSELLCDVSADSKYRPRAVVRH